MSDLETARIALEKAKLEAKREKEAKKQAQVALDRWLADNVAMRFNLLGQRVELFEQGSVM